MLQILFHGKHSSFVTHTNIPKSNPVLATFVFHQGFMSVTQFIKYISSNFLPALQGTLLFTSRETKGPNQVLHCFKGESDVWLVKHCKEN